MTWVNKENLTRFYEKLKEKMYLKTEVDDLLDNIDITGMVKQEEGGTEEEVVTPTNADTLGGKLTANNVVFYEEEITNEVGQVVLRNADLLENHPASYFATNEELNNAIANGTLQMDLLWTNASPTSAFTSQTLNINTIEYKLFLVYFIRDINASLDESYFFIGKIGDRFTCLISRSDIYYYNKRLINIDENRIFIGNSLLGNNNQDNNAIIPYKIYGVK